MGSNRVRSGWVCSTVSLETHSQDPLILYLAVPVFGSCVCRKWYVFMYFCNSELVWWSAWGQQSAEFEVALSKLTLLLWKTPRKCCTSSPDCHCNQLQLILGCGCISTCIICIQTWLCICACVLSHQIPSTGDPLLSAWKHLNKQPNWLSFC